MSHKKTDLPPDLLEVARALETHVPRLTDPELARVRGTVLRRATGPRRRGGHLTRSRLAITSMLAIGALMSTGGAALGVSALSTDLSARAAQYGTPAAQQPTPPTLSPSTAGTGGSGDVVDDGAGGAPEQSAQAQQTAQAPRQLEASSESELPFTGYLAIPLLLAGLALLAVGCVLRRGARGTPAQP